MGEPDSQPLEVPPLMKSATRTAAALAAVAALGVVAPTAGAKKHRHAQATCDNPPSTAVFSQFNDRRTYFPVPDGGFEAGATGWTLDGASVVDGNETFNLGGAADAKSLS